MHHIIYNRLSLLSIIAIFFASICTSSFASTEENKSMTIQKKLAELEVFSGGRIGISAINTVNNERIEYRAEERFPIQSTCKVMVAAAILKQSMTDNKLLQEKITYKKPDLVSWSPITEKHLVDGMTISELCAAAIMYSDNAATNLLMKKLGGPEGVTTFARSVGDDKFRMDHWEPKLNSNPEDLHDTSTPAATAKSLQQLVLGNTLALPQRKQLVTWMKDNTTGDNRIRAGVPKGWSVADKTGSGSFGITNDIGIIWPPKCAPIVVAIYFAQNKKDAPRREDVVASATRLLINEFAKTDQCMKLEV